MTASDGRYGVGRDAAVQSWKTSEDPLVCVCVYTWRGVDGMEQTEAADVASSPHFRSQLAHVLPARNALGRIGACASTPAGSSYRLPSVATAITACDAR